MRIACLALLFSSLAIAEEPVEIKIATLAPYGSAWAKIMEEGGRRLETETQGRVKLRYYFSGSQGDERDVVRKMKLDQLDGAALTAVGLGILSPSVFVLELPYLFTTDQQIDHVRDKLGAELESDLEKAGYVLISWGDVGWVHSFFTVELKSPSDLGKIKFWEWTDDPISREMFKILGVNAVPLGVPEVLQALQTNSIQALSAPPLAAVALQWYTKLKFMTDRPPSYAVGALVVKKAVLARLTPADREVLLRSGREMGVKLTAAVRRDGERATKAMVKSGIVLIHVPDDAQAKLVAAGKEVWTRLAGKLYSKELLDRVIAAAAEVPF